MPSDDGQTKARDGRRDVAAAAGGLAERLPSGAQPLARLAFNDRWAWLFDGQELFRRLDPTLWERSGWNPRWLLEALPPHRLRALAADRDIVARGDALTRAVDADQSRPFAPGP